MATLGSRKLPKAHWPLAVTRPFLRALSCRLPFPPPLKTLEATLSPPRFLKPQLYIYSWRVLVQKRSSLVRLRTVLDEYQIKGSTVRSDIQIEDQGAEGRGKAQLRRRQVGFPRPLLASDYTRCAWLITA
jgi:hypothetical protein